MKLCRKRSRHRRCFHRRLQGHRAREPWKWELLEELETLFRQAVSRGERPGEAYPAQARSAWIRPDEAHSGRICPEGAHLSRACSGKHPAGTHAAGRRAEEAPKETGPALERPGWEPAQARSAGLHHGTLRRWREAERRGLLRGKLPYGIPCRKLFVSSPLVSAPVG